MLNNIIIFDKTIKHPIPIGSKTNVGTIRNFKRVKYGYGKYRYFIEESDDCFSEEEILLIC